MLIISRTIGMLGVGASLLAAIKMYGGYWQHLILPSSIIGVIGMTMFGLFATYGKPVFGFILRCIVALFVKVEPNHAYSKIAALARSYSTAAGWLIAGAEAIHTVSLLDYGTTMVAKSLACAGTAIIYGLYLSTFVFQHFQIIFEEEKSHRTGE